MNKTFFTAVLACVLAICSFALSAAEILQAKMNVDLKNNLTTASTESTTDFGFLRTRDGKSEFVSLSSAMESASVSDGTATVTLGDDFVSGDTIQFGYANADGNDFSSEQFQNVLGVQSDPMFSYSYKSESFYKLDFSEDPFNGKIELFVMGTPLPASTVTLLVALGAAAAFLLYNNRRKLARFGRA